jgi:hypothetical protein
MNADRTGGLLDRLQARGVIDAGERGALAARRPVPWWLAALLAVAAWIASLIILSAFFGPLLMLADNAVVRAAGGVALIAAALYLFRRESAFTAQMALAFSLAGQALIVVAVAGNAAGQASVSRMMALTAMVVAAGLMWPPTSGLHRTVCALIVLASLAWLIGPGSGLALFGVAVTAAAAALWLTRARWAAQPHAPLVKALAHATTLVALCLAPYGHARSALDAVNAVAGAGRHASVPFIYAAGAAAVLLATVAWLTRAAPTGLRAAALGAALLFVPGAWQTPGLLASGALLLAVFHACHRPWVMLTLSFAALYLAERYYSLHATLLEKSIALVVTGALLLLARTGLRRWVGSAAWAAR